MATVARKPSAGGRRAEAERNDVTVLAAARDVFIEHGWDAPVSAVAARAGVGMGSIYRRYPSKTDLLREMCLGAMRRATEEARAARDEEPDGWSALRRFMRCMVEARSCSLFVLIGNSVDGGEIAEAVAGLRAEMDALVDAAHRQGALRDGVTSADIYLLLTQLRSAPSIDAARAGELQLRFLDVILDGLAAPGATTLTGGAATWPELVFRDAPELS
ncbi:MULTISPECIES: TetR/AcrR family transcriptional regulator [Amycolatopsis]|uniref:TetR/AcrR family transcriptional regulator n=1 Tax=Amycolatopsis tucumanensis TaxID=401106 RepID=A0ABP7HE68_9PSEU|nr:MULTISPECIES: TetR/AcrR family transcriptional regulator [Amycolatopsis]MCF6425422.1 TetR/AcrR family transcriptional regulator [Amycolatopsis tucumanensis]